MNCVLLAITALPSMQYKIDSIVKTPKHQRRIGAAKPERIRQYHIDLAFSRPMRHQGERCLDRGIVEVERRRCNLIAHCQKRLHRRRSTSTIPRSRQRSTWCRIGRENARSMWYCRIRSGLAAPMRRWCFGVFTIESILYCMEGSAVIAKRTQFIVDVADHGRA